MDRDLERLKEIVDKSDNIVFFGGAGVSTESNIPDFRSSTGLYSKNNERLYSPEFMLSKTFFNTHMDEFYKFYKKDMVHTEAEPNDAHYTLAELERMGKLRAVITQNIDGLHQKAGSRNVLELHGSVERNYCTQCMKYHTLEYVLEADGIPICETCGGIIKPDVVLYEEGLDMGVLNDAINYIGQADILIVGGTSLTVYPAANLITYYGGDKLVLINKSETSYDDNATLTFNESIGKVLKYLVE